MIPYKQCPYGIGDKDGLRLLTLEDVLNDTISCPKNSGNSECGLAKLKQDFDELEARTKKANDEFLQCIGLLEATITALVNERDFYKGVASALGGGHK